MPTKNVSIDDTVESKEEKTKLEERDKYLKESVRRIATQEGIEFEMRKKLNVAAVGENVAIIVGQKEEINAVRECQKLGIKMFNIVDTNCNPTFADHIIPANDDSRNSIKYVLNKFM